ncbi:unnamed protein product [Calypogeia fissa]
MACQSFSVSRVLVATIVMMVVLLSILSFQLADARVLKADIPSTKCPKGVAHVLECPLCDPVCCARASPCFTPYGCRPQDCT